MKNERAQVLPIMALLLVAFIGLLGLAIDVGRLFIARAELSRALDAAALAGVVELPDTADAQDRAIAYMGENLPEAVASFPAPDGDFQLRVQGNRSVDMYFMGIFGFGEVDIQATAAAGFGNVPIDVVAAIDSTGSMGASPCNGSQSNSGCPIKEAKDAAINFAELLLGAGTTTQVGAVPYRGCFNPPRTYSNCMPAALIADLTSNETLITTEIGLISATGGSGTNVCLGLLESWNVVTGPSSNPSAATLRFIILLSDGDNTYNSNSYGNGAPPNECRPWTSPWDSDGDVSSGCSSAQTRERQLDELTEDVAIDIEADDVEIYVVGFGVCGSSNTNFCNTGMIGGTQHDDTADRNLLKCVASSTPGTNDHYYEVPTAEDLPEIFNQIAQAIAFRLVE